MNRWRILTLLFLLVNWSAFATNDIKEEFIALLHEKSAGVETIACDFTQVKHNYMLARDVESRGKFRFMRPGKLTLLYDEPQGDRIVMGDADFLVVAGGARSMVKISSNPMFAQLQQVFTACFSGDISAMCSDGEFCCEKIPTGYVVKIIPSSKRVRRYISEIILTFSHNDMLLDELRLVETTGNYTGYRFSARKTNLPILESLFDCSK